MEIIVVDDCSDQASVAELKPKYPQVTFLRNANRQFLAASRNRGILASHGGFVFFVDDDNTIADGTISELAIGIAETRAAVACPIIYYAPDRERIWYAGSWMSPISNLAVFPYRGYSRITFRGPFQTHLFHDAFMVRRDVFSIVGPFDSEHFPIYLSEADYAERLRKQGLEVFVFPKARVWHDVPILVGFQHLLRHMHMTEPSRAYYVSRNRILFARRHRGILLRYLFLIFFLPIVTLLQISTILGTRNESKLYFIRHYLGGIIDGLRIRL